MNIKNALVKSASVLLTAFSVFGIYMITRLNTKNLPFTLTLLFIMLAAFVLTSFFTAKIPKKTGNVIFTAVSLVILLLGIFLTPYSPCHDSLDLHNVLSYMLHNNNSMSEGWYIEAYMNFFINNKFTLYIYLPFVRLLGSAEMGIRLLNGAFLTGSVFFMALSSKKILKKDCFGPVCFMLSLLSPTLLLSGPYIYLPSVFIASAALFCYKSDKKIGKIIFFVLAAFLFILRPTCFGFLFVFVALDAVFEFKGKADLLKKTVSLALTIMFALALKSICGAALYKTGIHNYPNMLNAAGVWTIELGTRINGEQTGTCFYTPFEPTEEDIAAADDVERDFYALWGYYSDDVNRNTDNYKNIVNLQNSIQKKIINRVLKRTPLEFAEHFRLKANTFFKDTYIPYYHKANLNDKDMRLQKDYDKKYFSYMNMIFLLFFLSMIVNLINVFKNRDKTNGLAAALGAAAVTVNIIFLLLTEVSKKYMFDFYVPMVMCAIAIFSFEAEKQIKAPLIFSSAAALILALCFNESLYNIKILNGAKAGLVKNNGTQTLTVKMKKECVNENYYIYNPSSDEKIGLYGKNEFSVTYPEKSAEAFILYDGSDVIKRFSASEIKN